MKTENTEIKKENKIKSFFKKLGTRNLVVICAVLLIGAAVGVNYILYQGAKPADTDVDNDLSGTDIGDALNQDKNTSNYFAQTVLSRKQARDNALEVLQTVAKSTSALPESVEAALSDIAKIAKDIENEANIETLVKAKGFSECIAVINYDSVTVIVKADKLLASQTAQINEIVYQQTGILPSNLKIIAKNV